MAVYIIAEAGVNHNGDEKLAVQLIDAALKAGADAVKFQTFNPDAVVQKTTPKAAYQKRTTDPDETQYDMIKRLALDNQIYEKLQAYAKSCGIEFLSTAFDMGSLTFLQSLDLPYYKIPSGEISNAPLLLQFAQLDKKLILSTGMSNMDDIKNALAVLAYGMCHKNEPDSLQEIMTHFTDPQAKAALRDRVTLLHCTSQYPPTLSEINLRAMDVMAREFDLPIGYSDHSQGIFVSLAAVACGAHMIEKHLTLDKTLAGPDHQASLTPDEFQNMVTAIRDVETALGNAIKQAQPRELDMRPLVRQHIVAARPIQKGVILTRDDLTTMRCAAGLSPMHIWDIIGRLAQRDYEKGNIIQEDDKNEQA